MSSKTTSGQDKENLNPKEEIQKIITEEFKRQQVKQPDKIEESIVEGLNKLADNTLDRIKVLDDKLTKYVLDLQIITKSLDHIRSAGSSAQELDVDRTEEFEDLKLAQDSTNYKIKLYSTRKDDLKNKLEAVARDSRDTIASHESAKRYQIDYDFQKPSVYLQICITAMKTSQKELDELIWKTDHIREEEDPLKKKLVEKYDQRILRDWELIKTGKLDQKKIDEVRERLKGYLEQREDLEPLSRNQEIEIGKTKTMKEMSENKTQSTWDDIKDRIIVRANMQTSESRREIEKFAKDKGADDFIH